MTAGGGGASYGLRGTHSDRRALRNASWRSNSMMRAVLYFVILSQTMQSSCFFTFHDVKDSFK